MTFNPFGESVSEKETLDRLLQMQKSMEKQIQSLEEEYSKTEKLIKSNATNNSNINKNKIFHAPHWDQVIQYIRSDQEEEAIYALVRVVQKLLDEKAPKKTLNEKANKTYVDDLFERVSKGVQENLQKSTDESLNVLQARMQAIQQKIEDIRNYMSTELSEISQAIDRLKQFDTLSEGSPPNEIEPQISGFNF